MGSALGLPSPSPPRPGQEQWVLWSQTSRCWAQVWDRAPGRHGSSRLEGGTDMSIHHPPRSSPSPRDGCIGMGRSAVGWAAGAGRVAGRKPPGAAFARRTLGGPGCPHSPFVVRRALSTVPALQRSPGSPAPVPPQWPAAPCSPGPGWGPMLHWVLGPSRTGCAWEPNWALGQRVRGWEGDSAVCMRPWARDPAGGPADHCHQRYQGSRGQRDTEHQRAPGRGGHSSGHS